MTHKLTLAIIFVLTFLALGIVAGNVYSDNTAINKAVAGPGW